MEMRPCPPKPVPRIWGGSALGFGPGIGEVWLCEESLLVKLLDPAEWLSVQVHPPHAYALRVEGKPGKGLFLGAAPGLDQSPEGRED